ncbi:MAG: hypothetical protein ACREIC_08435 [Limisphaerales bacterium]
MNFLVDAQLPPALARWIARRLQMGSWTYVSNLLNGERARGAEPANPNQQLLLYK